MLATELERHRPILTAHCYRMLGSPVDADDAVQETMVRAFKSLDKFDGRSSLRTWLHRIATNVCLDALTDARRRVLPLDDGPVGTIDDVLESMPGQHWMEPIPDAAVLVPDADPSEIVATRQSIRLAFVAALQHLPPKQRAALLLTEVLDWSAAEVAECLATSVAAVNSALQRARATLATRDFGDARLSDTQSALVDRYVEAFERYDIDALASLLHEDATMCMPPYRLWLRGAHAIRAWLLGRGAECRGSRVIRTFACGAPAYGQYRRSPNGGHHAWAFSVLDVRGDRVAGLCSFLDTAALFPRFGLPLVLSS